MSDLSELFAQAQENIKTLSKKPDDDTMLELYSLYKQGSQGDVTGERPGFFDFVGGAKFDARQELKGMSQDDAMQKYIDKVNALLG